MGALTIVETIPDNIPVWAQQAMDKGQLFKDTFDRVEALERQIKTMDQRLSGRPDDGGLFDHEPSIGEMCETPAPDKTPDAGIKRVKWKRYPSIGCFAPNLKTDPEKIFPGKVLSQDPEETPEGMPAVMADKIEAECNRIKHMLLTKNRSYGNSIADPVKIFAPRLGVMDRIRVRIDDKLTRLAHGHEFDGDDTELDLIGYLILKRVLTGKSAEPKVEVNET